jgi:type I restriction enzyme S subunit
MNKPTEKGLVPELRFPEFRGQWRSKKLGELCISISSGKDKAAENGAYDLYGSTGIIGRTLNDTFNDELILAARVGANAGLLTKASGKYGVTDNTLVITLEKTESIDFIYYTLDNFGLNQMVFGSGQPLITGKQLKELDIDLPSPKEQQKIADCLSSLDELVSAHNQKLDALKAHKKGLMQQLFPAEGETVPKRRFPEFIDDGDWVEEKLGNIANFASGGTPSKNRADYWDGEIPWISAASMHDIQIESSDRNITKIAVEDGAKLVSKGTLLLLVRGSMLHKRIPIGITQCEVAFNQDVKALMLKKKIHTPFLLYLLIACEMRLLSAVTKTGIGAGKLDTNDLEDFLICIPRCNEEQKKIADCLSKLDELITAQSKKIGVLNTHKKGLMQQLFPTINEVGA